MDLSEQSERMQSFYNLAHDPFGVIVDSMVFSGAGGRYETAETLRHLLAYSQQDSILEGPVGIGKRMLAQQVLKMLDETWRVAWVDATDIVSPKALEKELIGQFGLGLKTEDDTATVLKNINSAVAQRTADDEIFLLVVQRADRAEPEVLQALSALRDLASEPDLRVRQLWLVDDMDFLGEEVDEVWYQHQMLPLIDFDAEQYVRDRMIAAGYVDELPIPAADIARLNQLAGGIPAQLNDIVRDYLISSTFKTTEKKQGFPLTHMIAGLAALSLVIIAFLYQTSETGASNTVSNTSQDEDRPMTSVEKRLAEAVAQVEAKQTTDSEGESGAVDETNVAESEPDASLTVASTESEPEADEVADEPDLSAPVEEPSTSVDSPTLIQRGADAQYTLQLIGVRDQEQLAELTAKFVDTQNVEILETTYQSEPWFVLIYGQFNEREQAQAAVAGLPEGLATGDPWIRTFKSLRDSLQ